MNVLVKSENIKVFEFQKKKKVNVIQGYLLDSDIHRGGQKLKQHKYS